MQLHLFFKACNPSKTLNLGNPNDRRYYIDFAAVRGGKIVEALERTIARLSPDEPTCQLFSGHIGCGKSTELLRLKAGLEAQDFHVVYFESSRDLDMADVSVSDILLAIARSVSESLEAESIHFKPGYFVTLLQDVKSLLQTPLDLETEAELSVGIAKITAKAKDNPKLREQLKQSLEPRTEGLLRAINTEILARANQELKYRGKQGLVVIVDNLDRISPSQLTPTRSLPEHLFIDRGSQLRRLQCHMVYTIPLDLIFSNDYQTLKNRLGGGVAPTILPMIPIQHRDGREHQQGMDLLKQMILARAFPDLKPAQRLDRITELFDHSSTLDRLCQISGGHVRNLLGLLYTCLRHQDPPIPRDCAETVIRSYQDDLLLALEQHEWELIFQVLREQSLSGEKEYQLLLRSMFVFEYRDEQGRWFGINPALMETEPFKAMARQLIPISTAKDDAHRVR
ncbi:ATP-binding protein [Spirulina major CS-329]|uniref:ATP-binding protein n=1 Tax=Spirulina TaxID=1154 RepID=UPI00232C77BA|nr:MULTISPECIES: ATP-binding protein [Spirulina]MDB9494991.1 ATP-binding protein [Spirulina subsalsa CS-330]MDB9505507.1 ATP-binding protein [Spirulina major CS-329]